MVFEEIVGAKSGVWKYFRYDKNIGKAKRRENLFLYHLDQDLENLA